MTHTQREQRPYRKSTRSGGSGGNCVEWAHDVAGVYIRDSKDPAGPELLVTAGEWAELTAAAGSNTRHQWIHRQASEVHLAKDGDRLRFTAAEWTAFVEAILAGECARVAVVA
jgi:hypothetical protein